MAEIAFLRNPVAHGRIYFVDVPPRRRGSVFFASDIAFAKLIVAVGASAARGCEPSYPIAVLPKGTTFPLRFRFVPGSIPQCPAGAAEPAKPRVPVLRALASGPDFETALRKHRFP